MNKYKNTKSSDRKRTASVGGRGLGRKNAERFISESELKILAQRFGGCSSCNRP